MKVYFYSCMFLVMSLAAESGDVPICSSKQQVTTGVGDTAVLSCLFSLGEFTEDLTVVWMKTTEGAEDTVVHNQGTHETFHNQSAAYTDRTAMYEDWFQRKDATLNVARIREMDAGEYSCWIMQPPPSAYKCCAIRLAVEWKGDKKQLVVAWSIYFISLSLCLFLLYSCRQQKSSPDRIYDI